MTTGPYLFGSGVIRPAGDADTNDAVGKDNYVD
jgi:hypothetical protein